MYTPPGYHRIPGQAIGLIRPGHSPARSYHPGGGSSPTTPQPVPGAERPAGPGRRPAESHPWRPASLRTCSGSRTGGVTVMKRLVLALATLLLPAAARAAEPPPNVIVVLADDLGWTDLACF